VCGWGGWHCGCVHSSLAHVTTMTNRAASEGAVERVMVIDLDAHQGNVSWLESVMHALCMLQQHYCCSDVHGALCMLLICTWSTFYTIQANPSNRLAFTEAPQSLSTPHSSTHLPTHPISTQPRLNTQSHNTHTTTGRPTRQAQVPRLQPVHPRRLQLGCGRSVASAAGRIRHKT